MNKVLVIEASSGKELQTGINNALATLNTPQIIFLGGNFENGFIAIIRYVDTGGGGGIKS